MKFEIEITIKPLIGYEELDKILIDKGFTIVEKYYLKDIYMVPNNLSILELDNLEILKQCILIRDINNEKKQLTYKYKKYDDDGSILKQGKVICPILNIASAKEFMIAINYKQLLLINNNSIVYEKEGIELTVQIIKNQGIYIEIEADNKILKTEQELINYINTLNIPCTNNYFEKKALDALIKVKEHFQN